MELNHGVSVCMYCACECAVLLILIRGRTTVRCRHNKASAKTYMMSYSHMKSHRERDLIIIYKCSYCDLSLSEAVSHFRTMCII